MIDAEDLPPGPRRWLSEAAGAVALVVIVGGVAWLSQPLGPWLPNALDRLAAFLSGQ